MTRTELETLLDAKCSYWEIASEPHQYPGTGRQWAGKEGNPPPEHYAVRAVTVDTDGVATRETLEAIRVGDEWFLVGKDLAARPDKGRPVNPARP